GGEDGLNDGGVKVHHHCLWPVEFLQLPQEVHPLMCLFGEGADVQPPLEVLGDDGAQEAEGLCRVDWGVTQGDGGGWGWGPSEVYDHLNCSQSVKLQVVLSTPGHQMFNLPPVGGLIPTREEPIEGGVVRKLKEFGGLVTGGAAVAVQGKDAALRGTGADGLGVRDMFS